MENKENSKKAIDHTKNKARNGKLGMSIHIGLNGVDPTHYQGWDGKLTACEFDAKDMKAIADSQNFNSKLLLTKNATHDAVIQSIEEAAQKLKQGDELIITTSCHGGQMEDENGDEKDDHKDETWVLYDKELVDDELYSLFGKFEQGVRILILSDSCHSGTVTRAADYKRLTSVTRDLLKDTGSGGETPMFRAIPEDIQEKTYEKNKDYYSNIQKTYPAGERVAIGASVILLSGCQDNQLSADGPRNGLFTGTLRKVWNEGKFVGGYYKFFKEIGRQMPPYQSPNYFKIGVSDIHFERMKPFTLETAA